MLRATVVLRSIRNVKSNNVFNEIQEMIIEKENNVARNAAPVFTLPACRSCGENGGTISSSSSESSANNNDIENSDISLELTLG